MCTEFVAKRYRHRRCGGYRPGYPGLANTHVPLPRHETSWYNQSQSIKINVNLSNYGLLLTLLNVLKRTFVGKLLFISEQDVMIVYPNKKISKKYC